MSESKSSANPMQKRVEAVVTTRLRMALKCRTEATGTETNYFTAVDVDARAAAVKALACLAETSDQNVDLVSFLLGGRFFLQAPQNPFPDIGLFLQRLLLDASFWKRYLFLHRRLVFYQTFLVLSLWPA